MLCRAALALLAHVVQAAAPCWTGLSWNADAVELLDAVAARLPAAAATAALAASTQAGDDVALVLQCSVAVHSRQPLVGAQWRRLAQLVNAGQAAPAPGITALRMLPVFAALATQDRMRALLLLCDQLLIDRPDVLAGDPGAVARADVTWAALAAVPAWADVTGLDLWVPAATTSEEDGPALRGPVQPAPWKAWLPLAADVTLPTSVWLHAWPAAVANLVERENALQPRMVALGGGGSSSSGGGSGGPAAPVAAAPAPIALDVVRRLLMLAVVPRSASSNVASASVDAASRAAIAALATLGPAALAAVDPAAWLVVLRSLPLDAS